MKEKYKCIYSLKLAGYLMMHGYPVRRVEHNLDRPKWDVYLFDQSEEIEETIEFYKFKKTKEKHKYGINNEGSNTKTKG